MSEAKTAAIQPFQPQDIDQADRLSKILATSALLPDGLRNKPGDVLVTIITGHELGLSPMQAIRGLHVIKGRAVMSADLAVALVKRHPGCEWFRMVESDDKAATYETQRKGDPKPTRLSFTIQQAQQAGLGGDNWKKYPAAMLRARCSLALARAVYPDTMLGVYDPDELPDAPVVQIQPEERAINAPPPQEANGQRTATVKAQLAEKAALLSQTLGAPANTPMQRISFALIKAGKQGADAAEFIKSVTGKTKREELDDADVTKIQDALDLVEQQKSDPMTQTEAF